jgi:superfamily II DNA/RNA helicase
VLSPTRELAMQTAKFLKAMAKYTTLRYTLLVGGDSMEMQVRERRALVRRSLAFEQSRHPPCRLRMFL